MEAAEYQKVNNLPKVTQLASKGLKPRPLESLGLFLFFLLLLLIGFDTFFTFLSSI